MSVGSLIQDMKDEFGSISRHGLRASRSHGAVAAPRGSAAGLADALEGTFWAQLPPELLREVLAKVEAKACLFAALISLRRFQPWRLSQSLPEARVGSRIQGAPAIAFISCSIQHLLLIWFCSCVFLLVASWTIISKS